MHVEFIARGTGLARAAVDYLLGERDAAGKLRDGVEVRRGDPDMVAAVADSLEFEHKYTSGVIAWAPEDRPTDAQIEAVLDKFEQTAWAGLEPDRYAWRAVEHRERGGGVHVHVLAARCDLQTGKSTRPTGLGVFLVICGGSWGTMRWLSASIESHLQALAILNVDIEQARRTLAQLEKTTWSVDLREIDGERFVVLLERQLMEALRHCTRSSRRNSSPVQSGNADRSGTMARAADAADMIYRRYLNELRREDPIRSCEPYAMTHRPWSELTKGAALLRRRPRGFCEQHGKSYLTRRRRGGEGGGGGSLTGGAVPSAYRWAWFRWYSRASWKSQYASKSRLARSARSFRTASAPTRRQRAPVNSIRPRTRYRHAPSMTPVAMG